MYEDVGKVHGLCFLNIDVNNAISLNDDVLNLKLGRFSEKKK